MNKKRNVCCICGDNAKRLPMLNDPASDDYRRLHQVLRDEIALQVDVGTTRFMIGCHMGIELLAGEIVLSLQNVFSEENIELICVPPYPGHDVSWPAKERYRLRDIMRAATEITDASEERNKVNTLAQSLYIMDCCDTLIAVCAPRPGHVVREFLSQAGLQLQETRVIKPMTHEYEIALPPKILELASGPDNIDPLAQYAICAARQRLAHAELCVYLNRQLLVADMPDSEDQELRRLMDRHIKAALDTGKSKQTVDQHIDKYLAQLQELRDRVDEQQKKLQEVVAARIQQGKPLSDQALNACMQNQYETQNEVDTLRQALFDVYEDIYDERGNCQRVMDAIG